MANEALHVAIKSGDLAAVTEATKVVDAPIEPETLPLAASLGNAAVVEALIAAGAESKGLKGGWTAAAHAAGKGHTEVLAALIAHFGAGCLEAPPGCSLTPLLLAAQHGHTSCAALILDAAGDDALRAEDVHGRNALMLAACAGCVPLLELLVERGVPVDSASERDGRTALMWAIVAHRPAAVGALARLGADPTVRAKLNTEAAIVPGKPDREGDTAMDVASSRQGKDPTLRHLQSYINDWLKQREEAPNDPPPPMPPLPWVAHAEAFVASGGDEEAAPEPAATGEADKAVESDIFGDEDVPEDEDEGGEAGGVDVGADGGGAAADAAADAATEKGAATAAMAAAAASAADLDELD